MQELGPTNPLQGVKIEGETDQSGAVSQPSGYSYYEMVGNLFQNIYSFASSASLPKPSDLKDKATDLKDKATDVAKSSAPAIIGLAVDHTVTAVMKHQEVAGKVVDSFAPKILADGVKAVIATELSMPIEKMYEIAHTETLKVINNEEQEYIKKLDEHLNQVAALPEDVKQQMKEVSERLKEVCAGNLSATQAFPYSFLEKCYKQLGYKYPEKFGEKEYQQWCESLDQAVSAQQSTFKEGVDTYSKEMKDLWFSQQESLSNLKSPVEAQLQSIVSNPRDPSVEIPKEFARGAAVSSLEVLTNALLISRVGIIGGPSLIASMVLLNVILSAVEVQTHSSARIMEVKREGEQIHVVENRSLEFMKRLVNNVGVAGVAAIASHVVPGGPILKLFQVGVASAFAAGVAETFNPSSSSPSDIKTALVPIQNQLAREITGSQPNLFIGEKMKQGMESESQELFRRVVSKIPDQRIVAILNEKIDEAYPNKSKIDSQKKVEGKEEAITESSQPPKKNEMQDQIAMFAFICITFQLISSLTPKTATTAGEPAQKTTEANEEQPAQEASTEMKTEPHEAEKQSSHPVDLTGERFNAPISIEEASNLLTQTAAKKVNQQMAELEADIDEIMNKEINISELPSDIDPSEVFIKLEEKRQAVRGRFSLIDKSSLSSGDRIKLEDLKRTTLRKIGVQKHGFRTSLKRQMQTEHWQNKMELYGNEFKKMKDENRRIESHLTGRVARVYDKKFEYGELARERESRFDQKGKIAKGDKDMRRMLKKFRI